MSGPTAMHHAANLALLIVLFALAACDGTSSGTAAGQADRQAVAATGGERTPAAAFPDDGSRAPASSNGLAARNADDPGLRPLSTGDIDFYLTVMRAAADRVRHPTAADADALRRYRAWNAANTAAASTNEAGAPKQAALAAALDKNGAALTAAMQRHDMATIKKLAAQQQQDLDAIRQSQHPSPPLDTATMNHAMLLDGHVDDLIVQERHLDTSRYGRVREVIENLIMPPAAAALGVAGYCNGCTPGDWTAAQARQQHLYEQRLAAMQARNKKALAPYANEIRSLQAVVKPAKTP